MSQEIYNPKQLFWSKCVSAIVSPYYNVRNLFRKKVDFDADNVKTILVTEYHKIGDVIIIIPALKALKAQFPSAQLTLVCHPLAVPLAEYFNVADQVVGLKVPWTNWEWSLSKWNRAKQFIQELGVFDLAFDIKGDFRNSWLLWHSKSGCRFGYSPTGGSYFFTHAVEFPYLKHQSERALALLKPVGVSGKIQHTPPQKNLNGTVVIHPGASDPRRSWKTSHWFELMQSFSENVSATIVKTPETEGLIEQSKQAGLLFDVFEGTLIEFSQWLSSQRLLVAPDSMAGHLAAYLGIPVVSIFGSQNPNLTSPLGNGVELIQAEMPCNHKRNHWRLCEECMSSISVSRVYERVKRILSRQNNEL